MWGPENIAKSDNYDDETLLQQKIKVAAFTQIHETIDSVSTDSLDGSISIPSHRGNTDDETSEKSDRTIYNNIVIPEGNLIIMSEPGKEPTILIDDIDW